MDRRTWHVILPIVAALILVWLAQLRRGADSPLPPGPSVHLALGNPSGATNDLGQPDNYLLEKPQYALSYNNAAGTPNWVAWRLEYDDIGGAPRAQFYPDPDLPRFFQHVVPHDYTETGFDRGHLCPHGDRTGSPAAAAATFAMTNMIPQAPSLNRKAWADFEIYCRDLVRRHHDLLYIVAGPQGRGGSGSRGWADTIADGKVTVPAKCWKVVAVVEGGAGGTEETGVPTRLIAVVMPNVQAIGHGWAKYRVSVDAVEELTGYHFFDRVSADVIGPLKAMVDNKHVPPARPTHFED